MYQNIMPFANKYAEYIIAMLHYFLASKKNLFWSVSWRELNLNLSSAARQMNSSFQLCWKLGHRGGRNSNPDSALSSPFTFFPFWESSENLDLQKVSFT